MGEERPVTRAEFYEAFAKLFCFAAVSGNSTDLLDFLHHKVETYVKQLEATNDAERRSAFEAGWRYRNSRDPFERLPETDGLIDSGYRQYRREEGLPPIEKTT